MFVQTLKKTNLHSQTAQVWYLPQHTLIVESLKNLHFIISWTREIWLTCLWDTKCS
jgi:hypothetical protein